MVATSKVVSVAVTVATEVVAAAVVAAVAAVEAHLTAPTKELVAVAITEAKATRIAMSPAAHEAATTPATGLTRSAVKRLLKKVTTTTSPPTLQDVATYLSLRNSNLSGSPSTM
jgi:hypothetical protein